jgi:hypothetical protein
VDAKAGVVNPKRNGNIKVKEGALVLLVLIVNCIINILHLGKSVVAVVAVAHHPNPTTLRTTTTAELRRRVLVVARIDTNVAVVDIETTQLVVTMT